MKKKVETVPVTLITGYLGSGKTTLINYVLKNAGDKKLAVIVNDIGEVNIDEQLIDKGGVVSGGKESLVALSNGCICCTLREDLIQQLADIIKTRRFDHILIEASGICEPVPIAQTITYLQEQFRRQNMPEFCRLDAVVSVTDAMRLVDEFESGDALTRPHPDEDDIENLIIQQVEFCDIIILNKASEITAEEKEKVIRIIRTLSPKAKIIETDFCRVNLDSILDTRLFDFDNAVTSAGWFMEFEDTENEHDEHEHHGDHDDDEHEHEHHHHDHDDDDDDEGDDHVHEGGHGHHHHHHDHNEEHGTAEEYGIGTYVYYRRPGFDRNRFEEFVNTDFGRSVIRVKGMVYFNDERDMSYIYEQAGRQKTLSENGPFYATMPQRDIDYLMKTEPRFRHDWDDAYGDRLIKLVFIGQKMDTAKIKKLLDRV